MLKQPLLAPAAAAVPAEGAVGSDHAVARNNDRNAVLAIDAADRSDRGGGTDLSGHVRIASGFAIRNPAQRPPRLHLELRPALVQRHRELPATAIEVLRQLVARLPKGRMIAGNNGASERAAEFSELRLERPAIHEFQKFEATVTCDGQH